MIPFVTNIEDLKENREEIIESIITEIDGNKSLVSKVMNQIVSIVTSKNYIEMDIDIYETIEMAVIDVQRNVEVIDNHEMHLNSAKNNLPISILNKLIELNFPQ